MIRIRLSAAAKEDVQEAKDWYAERRAGLDLDFRNELESTFKRIQNFPESYPVVYRDVRRANLRRFPYSVFYQRRVRDLFVIAVVHQARHPRHWQSRT